MQIIVLEMANANDSAIFEDKRITRLAVDISSAADHVVPRVLLKLQGTCNYLININPFIFVCLA